MRATKSSNGLKVTAIAGTYVVVLAFDLPENQCEGLLGFSIHRQDHIENEAYYLSAMKTFKETDPGFPSGSLYTTRDHPIQSFQWADYSAKPGYKYTYTVRALKGSPQSLVPIAETKIKVTTESPDKAQHEVYFNRGTAASQEYVRRFGNTSPDLVPNNKAFEWLSRGIYEALVAFIDACQPGVHSLRIAAYEFYYAPLLKLLKSKIDSGVDIKIIYDARAEDGPKDKNRSAVATAGLAGNCTEREVGKSYISHNKFIVKLENGQPIEVWTGGMNFSEGGIFGHSNVAHVVNTKAIAKKYLAYWDILAQDLDLPDTRKQVETLSTLPVLPLQTGAMAVFSPRKNLDLLNIYSQLGMSAKSGLFMTFAFGVNDVFKEVYANSQAPLRFALLEKKTRSYKKEEAAEKAAEEARIDALRAKKENVFAIGNQITTNKFDGWVKERLSGLNTHVKYIHNKFMLVDPLGKNPIIVSGSANFSDASTLQNDENMVIITGNKGIADIYFGEFMRLFSHFAFREFLSKQGEEVEIKHLRTDNWWKEYFGDNARSIRRDVLANQVVV